MTLERLAEYRIIRELGAGAMGTVYLAERGGERVALKVLHPYLLGAKGYFKRFQREAAAGSRVDHENVVRVLDCEFVMRDERPQYFLVMEYVEGRSLRTLLHDLRSCPEGLLREIARQVAAGLAAIHAEGIVHRDIKPENLLITDDHRVAIMDLGVARMQDATQELTRDGEFAGSLLYSSPQQLNGDEATASCDLYALGVVLYELASGENPFNRKVPAAIVGAHHRHVPRDLRLVAPGTSDFFSAMVDELLAKSPVERFESATELVETLAAAEDSPWWRARKLHETRRGVPTVERVRRAGTVGREQDLDVLRSAWARARSGVGGVVLVDGERGIGRTRLVDEFLRRIGREPAHVLYGAYPPSGSNTGLSDALEQKFGEHRARSAMTGYLVDSPLLVPALDALVADENALGETTGEVGDALHTVLVALMRGMAEERPVLWVVEDLHFAAPENRRLVLSMARAVAGRRVLLIATTEPGGIDEELPHFARLDAFQRLRLERLRATEIAALLREMLHNDALAEELVPYVARKTDGVPFFVFELLQALDDGGFITELPAGMWVRTRDLEEIGVPDAVQDLVRARIAKLDRDERAVLDVAAAHGFEIDVDLTAVVLGRSRVHVLQNLAEIERRSGLVRCEGRGSRFDHHHAHECVYAALAPELAAEYHGLLADAIATRESVSERDLDTLPAAAIVNLARHRLHSSAPASALQYLGPSLRLLASAHRNSEALDLAERALGLDGLLTPEQRIDVLLSKAARCNLLARRQDWRAALEEALAIAAEIRAPQQARLQRRYADYLIALGENDEARRRLMTALDIAAAVDDRAGAAAATGRLGLIASILGRYAEALGHDERHLQLAMDIGDRAGEATARGRMGAALHALGRCAEALEQHEFHLVIARDLVDREAQASALLQLGRVHTTLGDTNAARSYLDVARSLCARVGARRLGADATYALARLADRSDELEAAETMYREALERYGELGQMPGTAAALISIAALQARTDRASEAVIQLDQARALVCEIEEPNEAVRALACGLRLDPAGAAGVRSALAERGTTVSHENRMQIRFWLWEAAGDAEDLDEAQRLLEHLRDHAPEGMRKAVIDRVPLHNRIAAAGSR